MRETDQMKFDSLFAKALKEWPKTVSFKNIHYIGELHTINDLYARCERNNKRYFGHRDEVIMRNLHDAIFVVLHAAAPYLLNLKMSKLRKDSVKKEFERRISLSWITKNDGWTNEDRKLVRLYLKQNQKTKKVTKKTSRTSK